MGDERRGSDGGTDGEGYVFLWGADRDPTAARAAYPGARFVARARLGTGAVGGNLGEALGEGWGLLLRLPVAPPTPPVGAMPEILTDDGRRFAAALAGGGRPVGDPGQMLAAARYWELPSAYIERLRRVTTGEGTDDEG